MAYDKMYYIRKGLINYILDKHTDLLDIMSKSEAEKLVNNILEKELIFTEVEKQELKEDIMNGMNFGKDTDLLIQKLGLTNKQIDEVVKKLSELGYKINYEQIDKISQETGVSASDVEDIAFEFGFYLY